MQIEKKGGPQGQIFLLNILKRYKITITTFMENNKHKIENHNKCHKTRVF